MRTKLLRRLRKQVKKKIIIIPHIWRQGFGQYVDESYTIVDRSDSKENKYYSNTIQEAMAIKDRLISVKVMIKVHELRNNNKK